MTRSLEGSSVLVTGADGFIGSHLVERLQAEGAHVRALCVYNSNGSHGWLDGIDDRSGIEFMLGDVRDPGLIHAAAAGVETIFHLAALIAIPYSYAAPRSYVETNVLGTVNVLEAARSHGTERMINTSTSEVYGTPDSIPIKVDHALKGQSPYSASKIAADKMCESYAKSFELPVVTLRPFNTFGPRQSMRAVIPVILAQLLSGAETVQLGSVTPQRDFTFVSDTVDGFVKMAEADVEPADVIQLGTGTAVSIGELFEACCEATGVSAAVELDPKRVRPAASEVDVLLSDPSQAMARLGWKTERTLTEGLAELAEWMRAHPVADATHYAT